MDTFLAVKFDIIGSRKLGNRSDVQVKLLKATEEVNLVFEKAIQSKFVVTHGDEGQGLLRLERAQDLRRIVEHYADALAPARLRFGVGLGTLNTGMQEWAIGMDGEAWYRAKTAIEGVEKERGQIRFQGFGEDDDRLLSSLGNTLLFLRGGWTPEQHQAVTFLEKGMNQAAAAEAAGVSTAAISKRLSKAGWHIYQQVSEALVISLRRALGPGGIYNIM